MDVYGAVYCASFLLIVLFFNCVAWLSVRNDKRKARLGQYRTSEDDLLFWAWLGGIGGLLAMCCCRHKISARKDSFMKDYVHNTTMGVIIQLAVVGIIFIILSYLCRPKAFEPERL